MAASPRFISGRHVEAQEAAHELPRGTKLSTAFPGRYGNGDGRQKRTPGAGRMAARVVLPVRSGPCGCEDESAGRVRPRTARWQSRYQCRRADDAAVPTPRGWSPLGASVRRFRRTTVRQCAHLRPAPGRIRRVLFLELAVASVEPATGRASAGFDLLIRGHVLPPRALDGPSAGPRGADR